MTSIPNNPEEYLSALPATHKEPMERLRRTLLSNLPEGFQEGIGYGMISYYVPHSKYPPGYHVNPAQPLPFINLASQKNYIALYHFGIYSDPGLLSWFENEYPKHTRGKLNMGKSCIRFTKPDLIPYELIGQLAKKMSLEEWIALYERNLKPN